MKRRNEGVSFLEMRGITLFLVVVALLILLFYMAFEAKRNRIRKQTITFSALPKAFDGYRLFFISDIHRRVISQSLLQKIAKETDIIIIGGDLCEKRVPLARIETNLKHLSKIAPCLFIWGNNDEEVGVHNLRRMFKKHGIIELSNGMEFIQKGDDKLIIASVDDVEHDIPLEHYFIPREPFSILVCHFPEVTEILKPNHPFSLILSGHTHGGQIRLFGWGIAKKGQWIKTDSYKQLISNGYGTTGLPLRLGAPCETHLITLTREEIS
jgi:predicted MPP superfamily phosphohydrolase